VGEVDRNSVRRLDPGMSRQQIVDFLVEHATRPSHEGRLDPCDETMVGGNPGCGDVITIYLNVDRVGDTVGAAAFTAEGCTISRAAASVLMEQVQHRPLTAIEAMDAGDVMDALGRDVVKSRPRCATLALSTLKGAVKQYRNRRIREQAGSGRSPESRPPAALGRSPGDPAASKSSS
jgi:nitrogen fixation NifU-like protein